MTDLRLLWDNNIGAGDLQLLGADLESSDGLDTAVLVSLFSNRRVAPEELPPHERDRAGWWGDQLNVDLDQIGSKLWLLAREKTTPQVAARARQYAFEALAWMIADDVATAVEVTADYPIRGVLGLYVAITLPDDTTREFQFSDVLRAL